MTTWDEFITDPWGKGKDHEAFRGSNLGMKPAPEYASSEVLLSGLYRHIGFHGVKEREVPENGRRLIKQVETGKTPVDAKLPAEQWARVLHGALESPKLPNQSAKRFLQLSPITPEVARYSGSARLAGNPWSPGDLVERMVLLGSPSQESAEKLWGKLFSALAISENDDVWARWVSQEFASWMTGDPIDPFLLQPMSHKWQEIFTPIDGSELQFPAKQFVRDLEAVIQAKSFMTRRQWVTLLEAVLRIGAVSHVLWICDVNQTAWSAVKTALFNFKPTGQLSIYPSQPNYFPYNSAAMDKAKLLVSRYMYARLGLNIVLWGLEAIGAPFKTPLSNHNAVHNLILETERHREKLKKHGVIEAWEKLQVSEARTLACTKGTGGNMLEFIRHAAGQRQTARDVLRGYDQGYIFRKKGHDKRARWVVGLGPVAVLAMAHCCLHATGGPRSVHRLCDHLAQYGILISKDDVASSDLGRQLRLLGLVLDSPDAESGILVNPPFLNPNYSGR